MLCTGGMGLMSVAKPMIAEVFSSSMPTIVTASFASSYLLAMAGGKSLVFLAPAAGRDHVKEEPLTPLPPPYEPWGFGL